jgi:hypothetical protein
MKPVRKDGKTMSAKHTPTPWHVNGNSTNRGAQIFIRDKNNEIIAQVRPLANAELIVRAVNSHEALLSAVYAAKNLIMDYPEMAKHENAMRVFEAIKKAIAQAEAVRS